GPRTRPPRIETEGSPRGIFVGARRQHRHQPAGRASRRTPVQDISDLPEGDRVSRTVALTGATGFIGWHVARRFLECGWQVRALVRPESGRAVPEGIARVVAPLREPEIVSACDGAA